MFTHILASKLVKYQESPHVNESLKIGTLYTLPFPLQLVRVFRRLSATKPFEAAFEAAFWPFNFLEAWWKGFYYDTLTELSIL